MWSLVAPAGVDIVQALSNLGVLQESAGKSKHALGTLSRAEQVAGTALQPDDPRMASLFVNLGGLHFRGGRLAAAESYFERAMAIAEKSLSDEHPLLGRILCDYAWVLRARKKGALATKLEKRGYAILRSTSTISPALHTVEFSDVIPRRRQ